MNFNQLEKKYQTEAAFNKMVNIFHQLIEEYGFLPSEIREGLFLAQYKYETSHPMQVIHTENDWLKIEKARELMRMAFVDDASFEIILEKVKK